mgnify:FL=1
MKLSNAGFATTLFLLLCSCASPPMYISRPSSSDESGIEEERITRYFLPKVVVSLDIEKCEENQVTKTDEKKPVSPNKSTINIGDININLSTSSPSTPKSSSKPDVCSNGFKVSLSTNYTDDINNSYNLYYNPGLPVLGWLFFDKDVSIKVNEVQQLSSSNTKASPQIAQFVDDLGQVAGQATKASAEVGKKLAKASAEVYSDDDKLLPNHPRKKSRSERNTITGTKLGEGMEEYPKILAIEQQTNAISELGKFCSPTQKPPKKVNTSNQKAEPLHLTFDPCSKNDIAGINKIIDVWISKNLHPPVDFKVIVPNLANYCLTPDDKQNIQGKKEYGGIVTFALSPIEIVTERVNLECPNNIRTFANLGKVI